MSRNPKKPSAPAGDNPAGNTRGKTHNFFDLNRSTLTTTSSALAHPNPSTSDPTATTSSAPATSAAGQPPDNSIGFNPPGFGRSSLVARTPQAAPQVARQEERDQSEDGSPFTDPLAPSASTVRPPSRELVRPPEDPNASTIADLPQHQQLETFAPAAHSSAPQSRLPTAPQSRQHSAPQSRAPSIDCLLAHVPRSSPSSS